MDEVPDQPIVKYHYRKRGAYKTKRLPHLSITQAAQRVGITERSMYRIVTDGRIPSVSVGRYVRIRRTDLADFIAARTASGRAAQLAHDDVVATRGYLPAIRVPWEPLGDLLVRVTGEENQTTWARVLNVDRLHVNKMANRGWLTLSAADRYAVRLGKHPVELWGAAFYAQISNIDLSVMDSMAKVAA